MANASSERGARAARPMSPHLQIYRMTPSMAMSILHRITGAALYFGTLIVAWVLAAAATGPAYYDFVVGLLGTWLGKLVLFGYTWTLFHHMMGGVRHFIWDFGRGFEREHIDQLAWATAIASGLLTALVWAFLLVRH